MILNIHPYRLLAPDICMLVFSKCSSPPDLLESVSYQQRAMTKYSGKVRVTAAVPSARETRALSVIPVEFENVEFLEWERLARR